MSLCVQRLLPQNGLPVAWAALYESAFPAEERRDLAWQTRALADAEFHCCSLLEDARFVGLLSYWTPADGAFIYIEHLAVLPERRGQGIGAAALAVLSGHDCPQILEIEPPADVLTRRRQAFYERHGFRLLPHEHWQLPYQAGYPAVLLRLMLRGAESADLLPRLETYLHRRVMLWRSV